MKLLKRLIAIVKCNIYGHAYEWVDFQNDHKENLSICQRCKSYKFNRLYSPFIVPGGYKYDLKTGRHERV